MKKVLLFMSFVLVLSASSIEDIKTSMMKNYLESRTLQKLHQKNGEQAIYNNYIYLNDIIKTATKYYSDFVATNWGKNNVKLSNTKSFTQYSDGINSREHIDFKNGEITIEKIIDTNASLHVEDFKKSLNQLKNESLKEAVSKDLVYSLVKKYIKTDKTLMNEKFLKNQIPNKNLTKNDIKEKSVTLPNGKKKKILYIKLKMVPNHLEKRAKRYKPKVLQEAKALHVKPSYVFSTIQTESYFNPLAISHIPAFGLMQIVPKTAGRDAYFHLYKKDVLLSPEYLYNPDNNIKIGTKYIQIIQKIYLKGIKDKQSLEYCTAIAYNAGIGNLYKSFADGKNSKKEAIKKINSMSAKDVYRYLRNSSRLTKEAREYVKKIVNYEKYYKKWDI